MFDTKSAFVFLPSVADGTGAVGAQGGSRLLQGKLVFGSPRREKLIRAPFSWATHSAVTQSLQQSSRWLTRGRQRVRMRGSLLARIFHHGNFSISNSTSQYRLQRLSTLGLLARRVATRHYRTGAGTSRAG